MRISRTSVVGLAMLAVALDWAILFPARADTEVVKPKGQGAKIDVKLLNQTMKILDKGTAAAKKNAVQRVLKSPEKYAPPVFYALSQVLFQQGEKDDAAFWFYAGQLRARYDANRCADVSARSAVAVLNETYGPTINKYTFQDIPKLEKLIPKVVEWDRKTKHDYDHRWINLHGMDVMIEGLGDGDSGTKPKTQSLPESQWEKIAEKTRKDYQNGF